jgi:hypothetical protein
MDPIKVLSLVLTAIALFSGVGFLGYAIYKRLAIAAMREAGLSDELIDQILKSPK